MSRVVPRNRFPLISFYKGRAAKWVENAALLGLDPQELATLQAEIAAAEEALRVQQLAQTQARIKTQSLRFALEALGTTGAGLIRQIRGRSATLGNQAYILSMLPVPEKGSPIAEPGTPRSFTTELQQTGMLTLRWECNNPRSARGTLYHVHRQVMREGESDWGPREFLGTAGRRKFVDATLPPGVVSATYEVQAIRSTRAGMTANHLVHFAGPRGMRMLPGKMQLARETRLAA
jgi:hypothetical protein